MRDKRGPSYGLSILTVYFVFNDLLAIKLPGNPVIVIAASGPADASVVKDDGGAAM